MQEFITERDEVIDRLVRSGDTVVSMLDRALGSLVERNEARAQQVIDADDRVDATFAAIQDRVVGLMAMGVTDPTELRLLAALLHVNIHVERMGDYAVNIARAGVRTADEPEDPGLADQLRELGVLAIEVARTAMRAFAQRDEQAARRLPALDDAVDQLNLGVFHRLVRLASTDDEHLWWATNMILVARQIERYGDHAVDIGEATIFAATGETVELSSNASRPAPPTD